MPGSQWSTDGTGPRHFSIWASAEDLDPSAFPASSSRSVEATRKPMFLLMLSGSFLFRYAQRALMLLSANEPPRTTRDAGVRPAPPEVTPAGAVYRKRVLDFGKRLGGRPPNPPIREQRFRHQS